MVALSLPIREFRLFKKEPMKRLRAHLESLPLRASRLHKVEFPAEIYGSGNIPCYQRLPCGPGWALVGDAHQIMDPWSEKTYRRTSTFAADLRPITRAALVRRGLA